MAYKQRSGLHFKGLFDNLKRVVTAKKVIKQDLENKSNPFIEGTIDTDVRVNPGEGRGFWSMPKEKYIKQASRVYRKTGLKPIERTRDIWDVKSSHFELPQSNKVNIEVGERASGTRIINMSVAKNSQKKNNTAKNKTLKVKRRKVKTHKVKTPKGLYLKKGKFIG